MTDDLPLSPQLRHQAGAFLSLKRVLQCSQKYRSSKAKKSSSSSDTPPLTTMSPSPMRDLSSPHIDAAHHRREAVPRPKEVKPLLTREPLPHDREKKPATQPLKKRKRAIPTKPALSFDPKRNHIPSGRQDPPASPPFFSKPSASESSTSTSSYDEQQTTPFVNREIHGQFYEGCDTQKRPRIFSECPSIEQSASSYPVTPCTDMNDMSSAPSDFYDSPVSCTSSSSPAPSDQSPCAPNFSVQVDEYARQVPPLLSMYPYGSQVQQPAVCPDSYGYPLDRPAQGYPAQYIDATYARAGPHGIPAYPEDNGYPYPPTHRYFD